MSREQNFEAQQRVDQPDAQNLSSGPLQELRRAFRQAVSDEDAAGRVIKGFLVEQETVPSSRIKVVMDLGGGVFSAFLGAENLGGGNIDFGQIVGGHDVAGNLEGSAQNLLDFTGQPPGPFTVKIKFSFVDGIQDNRAFWNEAANSEFVKPTQTRRLPQWQIAFTGHAGAEWITLAEVNWTGATIANADITDKRDFAIEGTPNPTATLANKWSHVAQDTSGFGVGEFDRTADRGAPAIGVFGIWKAIRAVARQLQDIKGGRESDLRFDWHSRVFGAVGETTVTPGSQKTKSLRTLDVVTFTCADGVTDQGDFNGLSAIHDCLKYIEDNPAVLPDRIRIVVKNRSIVADTPQFTWTSQVTITSKSIELYGMGMGRDKATGAMPPFDHLPALTTIDPAGLPAGLSMLRLRTQASLHIENFFILQPPDVSSKIFDSDRSCGFSAKDCEWSSASTVVASGGWALKCGTARLRLDNCSIGGVSFIGGRDALTLVNDDDFYDSNKRAWVHGTSFAGPVRLRHADASGASADDRWLFANGLLFERCLFTTVDESFVPLAAPEVRGMIDVQGARDIEFKQCRMWWSGDEDCIRIESFTLGGGAFQKPEKIVIEDCQFVMRDPATHEGFLTGAGGVNGTEGTGWAIKARSGAVVTDVDQLPDGIRIVNNRFKVGDPVAGFHDSSADAGAIFLTDCRNVHIDKNEVKDWTQPTAGNASDIQSLIQVQATAAGAIVGSGQNTWVQDNFIGSWKEVSATATWGDGNLICLNMTLLSVAVVKRNIISALANDNVTLNDPSNTVCALFMNAMFNTEVHNNEFIDWRSATNPAGFSTCMALGGPSAGVSICHNRFIRYGGAAFGLFPGSVVLNIVIDNNHFDAGTDPAEFGTAIALTGGASLDLVHVRNNEWNYLGVSKLAVSFGTIVHFSIFGNYFQNGTITHATLAGATDSDALGYGDATLNVVAAYT